MHTGLAASSLYNVGNWPVISKHGLPATAGYQLGESPAYALEGSIAVSGSEVSFLMNNLGFFRDARTINDEAATVPDSGAISNVRKCTKLPQSALQLRQATRLASSKTLQLSFRDGLRGMNRSNNMAFESEITESES
ncbi:hypothetical protein PABG_11711 [Paracoccidioides brasiliensis Pb03]|nr:hypothetical protein PABG_11711 [Paracoccidioides brasiliensis Pb03]